MTIDLISSYQECKTIRDVECRIVNIDKHGKYLPKVRWWQHRSHSCHTSHAHFRKSARMSQPRNVFLFQSRWRRRSVSISRPRLVRMSQLWQMSLSHRNSATESQGEPSDWFWQDVMFLVSFQEGLSNSGVHQTEGCHWEDSQDSLSPWSATQRKIWACSQGKWQIICFLIISSFHFSWRDPVFLNLSRFQKIFRLWRSLSALITTLTGWTARTCCRWRGASPRMSTWRARRRRGSTWTTCQCMTHSPGKQISQSQSRLVAPVTTTPKDLLKMRTSQFLRY